MAESSTQWPLQTGFNDTDYSGFTFVEGANLHFRGGQSDAFAGDDLPGGAIISHGGAVGVDEGVRRQQRPSWASSTIRRIPISHPTTSPFFITWGDNAGVYSTYSHGGLMLGTIGIE